MEANISNVLQHDTACISALHVLKVYAQRLGCDLNSPRAVTRTLGDAFLLVSEALADTALLQFPPSITAAAVLIAARKAQVHCAMSRTVHPVAISRADCATKLVIADRDLLLVYCRARYHFGQQRCHC